MDGYNKSDGDFLDSPKKSTGRKRRKSSRKRKTSSGYQEPNILISLLPFGAGQFQNENNILGGAFMAAEAFAVYWYWQNKSDADQAVADAETYFQRDDVTDEEKEQFESETATYVASKRSQQNMGLYGFLGLWAAGVGEAIYNAPTPPRKSRASRKKARRFLSDYVPTEELTEPNLGIQHRELTASLQQSNENYDIQDYRLDEESSDNHEITPNYENSDNHSLGFDYSNPDTENEDKRTEAELNIDDHKNEDNTLETIDPEDDSDVTDELSYQYRPNPPKISIGLVYDEEAILRYHNIDPYLGVKMSWGF